MARAELTIVAKPWGTYSYIVRTMVAPFLPVVSYETYRLRNRNLELSQRESMEIYDLEQQVEGLHHNLECFDGRSM